MIKQKHIDELITFTQGEPKTILEICKKFGLTDGQTRLRIKKFNLGYRRYPQAKVERNKLILEMARSKKTYKTIGEIFGVSKQCVKAICHHHGFSKTEYNKKINEKLASEIQEDIDNGLTYVEIRDKYTFKVLSKLNHKKLINYSHGQMIQIRDRAVTEKYKINVARVIVESDEQILNDPHEINSVSRVYVASRKNGFKKYPRMGDRYKGGCFEDEKILKYIKRKRDTYGWSFPKIAEHLNKRNIKTICDKTFEHHHVRFKYLTFTKKIK